MYTKICSSIISREAKNLCNLVNANENMRKTANDKCDVVFTPTSIGVNILQRAESNCRYYDDDLGSVLELTLLAPLFAASFGSLT